jgi:hypothetical protein
MSAAPGGVRTGSAEGEHVQGLALERGGVDVLEELEQLRCLVGVAGAELVRHQGRSATRAVASSCCLGLAAALS